MTRFGLSLLAGIVLAAGQSAADDSAYNRGVDAYKRKDYAEALAQWSASVAKGNIDAMNNLGYLLYYGRGTDRAPQDGVQLWRVAAFGQAGPDYITISKEAINKASLVKAMSFT